MRNGYSKQVAHNVIECPQAMKILEPLGDNSYGQKFIYEDYYQIFDEVYAGRRRKGRNN